MKEKTGFLQTKVIKVPLLPHPIPLVGKKKRKRKIRQIQKRKMKKLMIII